MDGERTRARILAQLKVNGTLVKKGNYDVRFDEKTVVTQGGMQAGGN